MGRGIPSELADTTKPGCKKRILHIVIIVKTNLNFANNYKYSDSRIDRRQM